MCGISGWINFSNGYNLNQDVHIEMIKKMNNTIIHRGPDQEGIWINEDALIGHRRLVVIDKEGGRQPMIYKTKDGKSIVLSFNGELYNFKEIKLQLQQLGHIFKSESDTEVLLLSYVEWGEQCLNHFNGIFAFAIYDESLSKLFLARDHIGVKPLFYCIRDNSILFGSELKVLLANDKLVEPLVDNMGIARLFYIGFSNIPQADESISFETEGEVVYWDLKSWKHQDDAESTSENIKKILESSLIEQTVSDVPVSFLLSGGLDSSSLVALTSSLAKSKSLSSSSPINEDTKLKTYSVTFEHEKRDFNPNFIFLDSDEPWAKKVASHIPTDHTTVECTVEQILENKFKIMRARDLPSAGQRDTSLYLLFDIVTKDNNVVTLSGEGSDEILSGYHWHSNFSNLTFDKFPWVGECWCNLHLYLKDEILNSVDYKTYTKEHVQNIINQVPLLEGENEIQTKQRTLSYLFIKCLMASMLERKDRVSMAHSLEVRVPFCNYKLVEYCFNIPFEMKNIDNIEKGILRRSMIDQLPHDVLYRRKSPYPIMHDKNYLKSISNVLQSIINDPNSPILKFIKLENIQKLIDSKEGGYLIELLIGYLIEVNQWIIEYKVKFI